MIACADQVGPRPRVTAFRRNFLQAVIAAVIAAPTPAGAAQIGTVVSIFNDDRFRGVSVSDGRPVGSLDISFDAPNGVYGSLSGTLVATRDEGIKWLSTTFNAGFAKQLSSGLTADVGVSHSRYSYHSGLSSGRDFTEAYAGLTGKNLGGRISVSPNYFGVARWTAHGELDAQSDVSRNTTIAVEVGLLVPLGKSAYEGHLDPQFDARLGLAQRAGRLTFHAAVSARSGRNSIYGSHAHNRVALVLGISTAL